MSSLETVLNAAIPPGTATGTTLFGTLVASFIAHVWGYLPGVVAVVGGSLAIVWYTIMIYESATVSTWRTEHAQSQKIKRIARLKAKEKVITAQLEALELKRSAAATAAELVRSAEQSAAEKVAAVAAAAHIEQIHTETTAIVQNGNGERNGKKS